jgi:acyl-CoA thioesterase II
MPSPTTFKESITLDEIAPGEYVSKYNPERMGNTAPIGYGGCTMSIAVAAAHKTVDSKYHLYSAQGNYLGPASTECPLYANVRKIRDTKSFATRQIDILQEQPDGSKRSCLIMIADFHVREEMSVLSYSAPPETKYSSVENCDSTDVVFQKAVEKGLISPKTVAIQKKVFALMARYFEQRPLPEGFAEQLLNGLDTKLPTTQDSVPPVSRTSGDWFKNKQPLSTAAEQVSALSFELDGKISFLPGLHNRLFLNDVGACSSLDFSMRIFTADINLNDWILREFKTAAGGEARTYSEARAWTREGKLIASMTQQCILRPKPPPKTNL